MPRRTDPRALIVLIGFVALCLLVAGADAALTRPAMAKWYPQLRHPPGTPPDWVFPAVWIPLYVAMGVAAWRVWRSGGSGAGSLAARLAVRRRGLLLWGWQLAVNACWTPVFFGLHRPAQALAVMGALIVLVALTLRDFRRLDPIAAALMAPYLLWLCYACWLDAGVAWLNPPAA